MTDQSPLHGDGTSQVPETSVENKKYLRYVLGALLLVGLGYAGGRYAQPAKVVTKTQIVTQTQVETKVVTQVVTQIKYVKVQAVQKDVHEEVVTTKHPDGTVVTDTKIVDNSKINSQVTDASNTVAAKQVTQDLKETETKVTTKTVTYDKSAWSLTLMSGLTWNGGTNILAKTIPYSHLMAGVEVDHRFIGPLSIGLWGDSHLEGGLALKVTW